MTTETRTMIPLINTYGVPVTLGFTPERELHRRRLERDYNRLCDMPQDKLHVWTAKLFFLERLTWNYLDTVANLCVQMRIRETRPLIKRARELKRKFEEDRNWKRCYTDDEWEDKKKYEADEREKADRFEEDFAADFDRLFYGLELDVNKLDLKPGHKALVIAVQQTLTLLDAVALYSEWLDDAVQEWGVWTCRHTFMQSAFRSLYALVPEFAGDCYQPDLSARKTTARILYNRLRSLECEYHKDGSVHIVK